MNIKKSFLVIFTIIIFFIFFFISCTENGVESSLTGKWIIVDFEHDDMIYDPDDVDGLLKITYSDTYDMDMEYKINGIKYEIDDYGTVKACASGKVIQFFSDDDDGTTMSGNDDSFNCRYVLNGSSLVIYDDDITIELTKNYE